MANKRLLSDEQLEKVKEYIKAGGVRIIDIAVIYGVPPTCISQVKYMMKLKGEL